MSAHFSPTSFSAGLVIGALLSAAWLYGGVSELPDLWGPSSTTSSVKSDVSESRLLSVADQSAGSEVMVASVATASPGVWVAVRETVGETLGNVLGAARVGGPRENVVVSLLRATEPSRTYALQLYRDDNNGTFDLKMNSVYVDFETGSRVVVYFKTLP